MKIWDKYFHINYKNKTAKLLTKVCRKQGSKSTIDGFTHENNLL